MYNKVLFLLLSITKSLCFIQSCYIDSVDISSGKHLLNKDIYFDGETYTSGEYVIDKETNKEYGCVCMKKTCMRKCCPLGKGYDYKKKVCIGMAEGFFNPQVWDDHKVIPNANVSEIFHIATGKLKCSSSETRFVVPFVKLQFHFGKDSQPHDIRVYEEELYTHVLRPDKYCIETFFYLNNGSDPYLKMNVLACLAPDPGREDNLNVSSIVPMLISCVFILATVAVYSWLPELRNLHGRVLVAYLLCLFVRFIFFVTMMILFHYHKATIEWCLILTFVAYFFYLASFFWLNVICFDIWWTFSNRRQHGFFFEELSTNAKFCVYALYALGIPGLLTCILAGLEFSGLPYHPFLPNIIKQGCFLHGKSRFLYLYSPMFLVSLGNLAFFVLTITKIARIKQQTALLNSGESRTTNDQLGENRKRLFLYAKLFVLMGVNWLTDVLSAHYPIVTGFWLISDMYNCLIGLVIFVVFVCKPKVFRLLRERLWFGEQKKVFKNIVTQTSPTFSDRNALRTTFETKSETVTIHYAKEKNSL